MGFGPNDEFSYSGENYGSPDAWGGPMNGVDVLNHLPGVTQTSTSRVPEDTYMFLIIIGALATLWLLGGVAFKHARLT
jgi:hypothetical protein